MHSAIETVAQKIWKVVSFLKLDNLKNRIIAIYALNVFDLLATALWICWFGLEVEANPLARWMFANNSIYLFKGAVVALGCYALNKFLPSNPKYMWTSWLLLIAYGALAIYHCFLATQLILIFSRI